MSCKSDWLPDNWFVSLLFRSLTGNIEAHSLTDTHNNLVSKPQGKNILDNLRLHDLVKKGNIYQHIIVSFVSVSHNYCTSRANGGRMHMIVSRQKTGTRVPSASNINFRRGLFRVLAWLSQTFAAAFTNFCLGYQKLLPWRSQTFAVAFTNFCRAVQSFGVAFTNFCRGVHKLLPWLSKLLLWR